MLSDFKIVPIILLRELDFGALLANSCFMFITKEKLLLNLYFLLLLSERGLSPKSLISQILNAKFTNAKCLYEYSLNAYITYIMLS